MTGNNPMSFFSENVDAWGPLEWFDRLAKAVHARGRAVSEKDDLSFELYQNIASSSATRLVSDFEDKVRMALTTLRELEKANVAYVDANTELLSTLEILQRENEELKRDRYDLAYAITGGEDAPGLLDSVPTSELVEIARDTHRSHSADIDRAEAAEAEVKRLRAEIDRKSSMPGDHRYWEGRYRDEAAHNDKLRELLKPFATEAENWHDSVPDDHRTLCTEPNSTTAHPGAEADFTVGDLRSARTALASTGGEHHAE